MAVGLNEVVRFFGAPRSGGVVGEVPRGQRFPDVEDRLDDFPAGFHHVGALEQRGIAEHAVVEQALVAGARLRAEVVGVVEVHVDFAQADDRPGDLRSEAERDAFVRLQPQHEPVAAQLFDARLPEKDERRAAKLNDDLGRALRQALSRA